MNKQPEVCERTKENLVEAFWKLYRENTVNKITVKNITNLAGYNRCTFYQYFSDIHDLMEYAENKLLAEMLEFLESIAKNYSSKGIITKITMAYEHYGHKLSILFGQNGDPAFARKYKKALLPLFVKEFDLDQNDPRVEIFFEYSLGAIISAVTYWYDQDKPISAESVAGLLHTSFESVIPTLKKSVSIDQNDETKAATLSVATQSKE